MGTDKDEVDCMVLGRRGYIFTLITSLMIMTTLSLVIYYTEVSSPKYDDYSKKMGLNELNYYVESLKDDASRAISISAQRAATYTIDHTIATNETFEDYVMSNCTQFNYTHHGVEAALSELIVCGTLQNSVEDTTEVEAFMVNNTILDWIKNVNNQTIMGSSYQVKVSFRWLEMAQYDSSHFVVFSEFDFYVLDNNSNNRFVEQKVPITSVISISALEDPLHSLTVDKRIPENIRTLRLCEKTSTLNGSVIDDWIDEGCYFGVKNNFNAPSFFDRLEGRKYLSAKFIDRSVTTFERVGYSPKDIAIESFMNINLLDTFNVSVNPNLSQVDYEYWQGQESKCKVDGMEKHKNFRINPKQSIVYNIKGLNCQIMLTNTSGTIKFDPASMVLPLNTKLTFKDTFGKTHTVEAFWGTNSDTFTINGWNQEEFIVNETGDFVFTEQETLNKFAVKVTNDLNNY